MRLCGNGKSESVGRRGESLPLRNRTLLGHLFASDLCSLYYMSGISQIIGPHQPPWLGGLSMKGYHVPVMSKSQNVTSFLIRIFFFQNDIFSILMNSSRIFDSYDCRIDTKDKNLPISEFRQILNFCYILIVFCFVKKSLLILFSANC